MILQHIYIPPAFISKEVSSHTGLDVLQLPSNTLISSNLSPCCPSFCHNTHQQPICYSALTQQPSFILRQTLVSAIYYLMYRLNVHTWIDLLYLILYILKSVINIVFIPIMLYILYISLVKTQTQTQNVFIQPICFIFYIYIKCNFISDINKIILG